MVTLLIGKAKQG